MFLPQSEAQRDESSDIFAEWTWPPMLWMTLMRWGKDWPIPTGSTSAERRSVGVLGVEGLSDLDQRAPACCSDEGVRRLLCLLSSQPRSPRRSRSDAFPAMLIRDFCSCPGGLIVLSY